MRRRTISMIIVMLLVSLYALFSASTDGNSNTPQEESATRNLAVFDIQCYKRAKQPLPDPGADNNNKLLPEDRLEVKMFDSISQRNSSSGGALAQMPSVANNIPIINLDSYLNMLCSNAGLPVAGIEIFGTTAWGQNVNSKIMSNTGKSPNISTANTVSKVDRVDGKDFHYLSHKNRFELTVEALEIKTIESPDGKNKVITGISETAMASPALIHETDPNQKLPFDIILKCEYFDMDKTDGTKTGTAGKNERIDYNKGGITYWTSKVLVGGYKQETVNTHNDGSIAYVIKDSSENSGAAKLTVDVENNAYRVNAHSTENKYKWTFKRNYNWSVRCSVAIRAENFNGALETLKGKPSGNYRAVLRLTWNNPY